MKRRGQIDEIVLVPGRYMVFGRELLIPDTQVVPIVFAGAVGGEFTITNLSIERIGTLDNRKAKRGKYWERGFGDNVSRETNGDGQ